MNEQPSVRYAGPVPRLLAAVYDLLPVIALWFLVGLVGVALNGGEALTGAARFALLAAVVAVTVLYLALSWQRAGQTLGMRAWRLRLVDAQGAALGWRLAIKRAVWALLQLLPLGLGLLPVLFDRERRSLADRICDTRVLRLPKSPR
ncbi:MAG TPA: RDD family protein [Xanthomonadaceae bacterium]|nr:RDD family protein [Xanthomonadaceae bacterium]